MSISNQKGDIGEAAMILAATKKGFWVAKMPQDCPYDLIIDRKDTLGPKRVQVKYRSIDKNGSFVLSLTPSRSNRNDYTRESIDYFGVYLSNTEECFLIPMENIPEQGCVTFRCVEAKNNQAANVRSIYQFEKL